MKQGRGHAARIKEHKGRSKGFNTDQSKGSRYLNFVFQKKKGKYTEEGLNGCVNDSLSESL